MTASSYAQILFRTEGNVAVLTLNRPERLNAWTRVMNRELADAIGRCNEDASIGAIVVTGAGRGFCAGADIRDNFKARLDGENEEPLGDWIGLVRGSKPIVAAVNGPSVGVGATMILPMDVIVASEAAKFAMAFVKMGLTPELASSHFLVQRMGFGRASEMCLSGRLYSGAEAYELGLADRLAAPDAPDGERCGDRHGRRAEARGGSLAAGLRERGAQGSGQRLPREASAELQLTSVAASRPVSSPMNAGVSQMA